MSLSTGSRIGPYEVMAQVGAGAMGEVYRARDTRLRRTVAIKVLPPQVSGTAERRERFEREAMAVASLNHPNICALHDVGRHDDLDFLVMEYLDGQTLAERLLRGPLAFDQALRCAIEIAGALDHAHRRGIVHRDLKPGNVMLTRSGSKLLDFGLAKLQPAPSVAALSTVAGKDSPLTAEGTILGTFQYMAPEQLESREADARTDIFAFGAVVYEMVTGAKAFGGKTQASIIGAILHTEPTRMADLQPITPPAFDRAIKRCLAKDPDDRWQTARDLWLELKWIAENPVTSTAAVSSIGPAHPMRTAWSIGGLALVAVLAGAVVGWKLGRNGAPAARAPTRFVLTLAPGERLAFAERHAIAISADGAQVAYAAERNGRSRLYLRRTDAFEATPLSGTEDATGPFFSPDGAWVGFFAGNRLKKISLMGGAPVTLATVSPSTCGSTWGPGDNILFSWSRASGLWQMPVAGGVQQIATRLDLQARELGHRWPQLLPGGKAVLFTVGTGGSFDDAHIAVQHLETGERKIVLRGGTSGRYVPTGHLVFARSGALLAAPFDLGRLEVTGTAVQILQGVRTETSGAAQFAVAGNGTLVYVAGTAEVPPARELLWVDRQGVSHPVTRVQRAFRGPRLSPGGGRVALQIEGPNDEIWVYDLGRGTSTRLTLEPSDDFRPIWTPDGRRITYTSESAESRPNIFWKPADGSGSRDRLLVSELAQFPSSWSPDGRALAYVEQHPVTRFDIWILPIEGDRRPRPFIRTPFEEAAPVFSPDGRWLVYSSDESGRDEIYAQAYPEPGSRVLISTDGGTEPAWAPGGRELFYRYGDAMMAVDVRTGGTLTAGRPRLLFRGRYLALPRHRLYDVDAEGRRFLMTREIEEPLEPTPIHVVLEWFGELNRLARTAR